MPIDHNIDKYTILSNASIKDALTKINNNGGLNFLCIVNENQKLIGVLTEGDIRRYLLKSDNLSQNITEITNKNPVTAETNSKALNLETLALSSNVEFIPIVTRNGNLESIFYLHQNKIIDNYVFIMAGGLGTRLYPITHDIPKPLVKLGETPILDRIINSFVKQGFVNFIICVNHKKEMIKDHYDNHNFNHINIEYIEEEKRMGTIGAISLFNKEISKPIILTNCDIITQLSYNQLIAYHNDNRSDMTICTKQYSVNVPYGVIEKTNDKIVSIKEKPSYFFNVNTGIYCISPKIINKIPRQYMDATTLIESSINDPSCLVNSFEIKDHWIDVGTISELERAKQFI